MQISQNEIQTLLGSLGSLPEPDLRRLLEDLERLETVKEREDAANDFMHFVKKVWPHFKIGRAHV